jgi:hypothetical protein
MPRDILADANPDMLAADGPPSVSPSAAPEQPATGPARSSPSGNLPRNNGVTKFRNPEKLPKRSASITVALLPAQTAQHRKTEMRKLLTSSAIIMIGWACLAVSVEPSSAKVTITRIERCNALERQFNKVIGRATARRAAEARALQKRAATFCAGKEQAQGIRAYAKALRLLGVQPIDQ